MNTCSTCVSARVCIWVHIIQYLYYSPFRPSSPARQLAIQRCIPSVLCVSLSAPPPPVPAISRMLLLFFRVPQDAKSSPPDGGGSRLPRQREMGPR